MELLDEIQVKAINLANGKNLPEVPTLMFEFIGTGIRVQVPLTILKYRVYLIRLETPDFSSNDLDKFIRC